MGDNTHPDPVFEDEYSNAILALDVGSFGHVEANGRTEWFVGYHADGRVYPLRLYQGDSGTYAVPASKAQVKAAVNNGLAFGDDPPQAIIDGYESWINRAKDVEYRIKTDGNGNVTTQRGSGDGVS